MDTSTQQPPSRLVQVFSAIERWGQKLPDPLTLFAGMALLWLCFQPFSLEQALRWFSEQAMLSAFRYRVS